MSEVIERKDQACSNCYFSPVVENDQCECRCNPPQVLLVPAVSGIQGGGLALQPVFPMMHASSWCGKWVPDLDAAPPLTVV